MIAVHTDDIQFVNRQRREFNKKALLKLATSIKLKGLLHPVVVQADGKTLVAGERRVRAMVILHESGITFHHDGMQVPLHHIPTVIINELKPDDVVEAELEENLLREDLTWAEEADAIAKLHKLRATEAPQTLLETAREMAGDDANANDQAKVREALLLKEHLDDPDVMKAKSRKEALKIVRKKKTQEMTDALAQNFNIEDTPHIFMQGDFRNHTHYLEASSVDVICTDPPYGIGADNFGSQADALHGYEDSPAYFEEIMEGFLNEASRVTKPQAHAYIFCDPRYFTTIQDLMIRRGWGVWPTPLIWNKANGMLPQPDFGPRRTYEFCLFANKGNKPVTAVYNDVISIQGLSNPTYGAEKPAELYENLLARSVRPGNLIWDPFAGAGPVFPAANRYKCRVVASELSREKYNHALLRLDEEG